ncbi:DNA/RNA non-specific endonuclease [Hydrogenophaga sp. 2FB]|uniref:DNA/RNA non-specific endonuclease n=1 Tax=Hydrogenophaga sp. 2FB TaxID=2502187 RepID=UPI0010F66F6F
MHTRSNTVSRSYALITAVAVVSLSLLSTPAYSLSLGGFAGAAKKAAKVGVVAAAAGGVGTVVAQAAAAQVTSAANTPPMPQSTGNFGACADQFYGATLPSYPALERLQARALCFDGFAVLHSGVTKTPLYVAEVLTRSRIQQAKSEARTDVFFADARLPSRERASLDDYRGSGYDRGHMAPAADMDNAQSMAQSFSLANTAPQAAELNRNAWAKVEIDTRRYVMRASGPVYVLTGPVFADAQPKTVGKGRVFVPTHFFKLVYDPAAGRAWAHWAENTDAARIGAPISYGELVKRTGVSWLPSFQ